MMLEGIKKALDAPKDESRLRFVCFFTDGYIGNETEILAQIHDRLGATRFAGAGFSKIPDLDRVFPTQRKAPYHAFAREFEEGIEVLGTRADQGIVGDGLFQTLTVLHHLLAFFGLVPEVGIGCLFVDLG